MAELATPGVRTIDDLCAFVSSSPEQCLKTLIVSAADEEGEEKLYGLMIRGDHELNEVKAQHALGLATEVTFATEEQIKATLNCSPGSLGPVNLNLPMVIDHSAAQLSDFTCGANRDGFHLTGVNWQRDCGEYTVADIRNVVAGDASPDGKGVLEIKRGIEVGHIFQLGTKYSEAMKATVLDENGKERNMSMGCYGIGVSRIVAAAIEQNHDDNGIIWPEAIAPFQVAIVPINMHKSELVKETCEALYEKLSSAGYEVLFMDEAKARLGGMLADVELIGIPHRIVIGDRGLEGGTVEYRNRREPENQHIAMDKLDDFISENISNKYLISALLLLILSAPGHFALAAVTEVPEPSLVQALKTAASAAHSFDNAYDAEVWLVGKDRPLAKIIKDPQQRLNLLKLIHAEASLAQLQPEIVLALIEVESRFDSYAVSSAGAMGMMQIMPFWKKEIGRPNDNLIDIQTNLRYGCTILRYYLDKEKGRLADALARYNGSYGQYWYAERVLDAWAKNWR